MACCRKNVNVESVTLWELSKGLNVKQVFAVLSIIVLALSTTYGYGYSSAQSRAESEMILHKLEDEKERVEDLKTRNEKDLEINKLRIEIELRDAIIINQATPPPKQPAIVVKPPKWNER